MNLKLNMKDINKILAKAHFKCNFFLSDAKKQNIFKETYIYEAVGSLPVMPSLLPHFPEGEVKSPFFLQVW
jgi:hypothetical protein